MYYLPQPPFLIPLLGFLVSIACGTVFQRAMEQKIRDSYRNPKSKTSFKLDLAQDSVVTIGYCGICMGVWLFLGGGLLVLGFGVLSSFGFALILTTFTAGLVWDQINDVLKQLKEGGSEALKIDDFT